MTIHRPPPWLLGALCYGLAWPVLEGVNMSWLAWGAFVPLFISLERQPLILPFLGRAIGFFAISSAIACWWWLFAVPPYMVGLTWVGGTQEILLEAMPLVALFFLRKRLSWIWALWVLVFLWPVWEWASHQLPFTISSLFIGYTQAGNTALIQYADLTGVWGITAWVLAFNVGLYHVWIRYAEIKARAWRMAMLTIILFSLPFGYGLYKKYTLPPPIATVPLTLLVTDYPPSTDSLTQRRQVQQLIQRMDTLAINHSTALFVWAESLIDYDWNSGDTRDSLYTAVDRWQTPLLTGMIWHEGDTLRANVATLLSADDTTQTPALYHKQRLVPFWEGLPFYSILHALPAVRAYHQSRRFYTPGDATRLLTLETQGQPVRALGTPICHEQYAPALWTAMARQGADFFVQLSYERWFGTRGFQTMMANVTRLRSIEQRRSTARNAHGGTTTAFDAFGHTLPAHPIDGAITVEVPVYTTSSWYTRFPHAFLLLCGALVLAMLALPSHRE